MADSKTLSPIDLSSAVLTVVIFLFSSFNDWMCSCGRSIWVDVVWHICGGCMEHTGPPP